MFKDLAIAIGSWSGFTFSLADERTHSMRLSIPTAPTSRPMLLCDGKLAIFAEIMLSFTTSRLGNNVLSEGTLLL